MQKSPLQHSPDTGILTPKTLPQKYPAFTEGGIRHLIFFGEMNGFNSCLRRVGRKILIIEAEFLAWVDAQSKGGSHE